ncbi:RIP metalloprotease RseP [Novosphingobium sp. 1949]|uniref:Zinc metalloprotease n=1 Tax=Novosphingobium organovorum TaxID=2930092 RepID=A0ABT0B8F6_9SPHN|nr:RIP metalloprotease RseP [Novosphingobium organovorum]MCJ2181322.1 RIP metalloprotease RseP [Novosphingobium organovorum]
MSGSPGFLTMILAFALLLGPLVLIHELGHYLVGRWFGVKADAFSIGFGKEIAGWTDRRGTRWKLSMLPLGGYVQFAGDMNPASMPAASDAALSPRERAQTFHVKPLWQRALIVLAGPMTNFLVCVAILAAFTLVQGKLVIDPQIADFSPRSTAREAGLREGDRITAIDGQKVEDAQDVVRLTLPWPGRTVSVTVDRDGDTMTFPVPIASREESDGFGKTARIGDLGLTYDQPVVDGFTPDSPARAAGLEEGDRIVRVGDADVTSFEDVIAAVQPQAGQTLPFTVLRGGHARVFQVPVKSVEAPDGKGHVRPVGMIGVAGRVGHTVPVGPLQALGIGVSRSFQVMGDMVTGLRQMVLGERSVKELGGPIKIAQYSGAQFQLGWEAFVHFVALISINLAFINLLPIPGLDGGHLAFYVAEWVRRKPLDGRSQEWAIRTGVVFVLALMVFVTVNDLASLPIFGG